MTTETTLPRPTGFLDSFRVLGDGLLAMTRDRLTVFVLELQEEKFRLIQTMIWIGAAMFTGFMAVAFGSILLVFACAPGVRVAMLGALTAFYLVALVAILIVLRRSLARCAKPFAATLQAFGDDCACIRSAN